MFILYKYLSTYFKVSNVYKIKTLNIYTTLIITSFIFFLFIFFMNADQYRSARNNIMGRVIPQIKGNFMRNINVCKSLINQEKHLIESLIVKAAV